MKKLFILLLGSIFFISLPFDSTFAKEKKSSSKKKQTQTTNNEEKKAFYHLHLHASVGPVMGWLDKNTNGSDLTSYQSDVSIGNLSLSAITQYAPEHFPLGFSLSIYLDSLSHSYEDIDPNVAGDRVLSTATSLDLFVLLDFSKFTFFGAGSFFYIVGTDINTDVYDPQRAWGGIIGLKYRLVNSFALLFQTSYQKMFETTGTSATFNGSIFRVSFGVAFTLKFYLPSFA